MNIKFLSIAVVIAFFATTQLFAQTENKARTGLVQSFDDLTALLKKDSVGHKVQPESNLVLIAVQKGPIDGVSLIRWDRAKSVADFIQPMTLKVPEEKWAELEAAIVRMNHALPLPGLGLNHGNNTAYFRITLPFQALGGLPPATIQGTFSRALAEGAHLQRTLEGVINGETKGKDIVAYHNQLDVGIDRFPVGSYQTELAGSTWTLTLLADKSVVLLRDGTAMVQSSFKSRGNRIVLDDKSGPLSVKETGVYRWKTVEGGIQFERERDASDDRAKLLTAGVWTKSKND